MAVNTKFTIKKPFIFILVHNIFKEKLTNCVIALPAFYDNFINYKVEKYNIMKLIWL